MMRSLQLLQFSLLRQYDSRGIAIRQTYLTRCPTGGTPRQARRAGRLSLSSNARLPHLQAFEESEEMRTAGPATQTLNRNSITSPSCTR